MYEHIIFVQRYKLIFNKDTKNKKITTDNLLPIFEGLSDFRKSTIILHDRENKNLDCNKLSTVYRHLEKNY